MAKPDSYENVKTDNKEQGVYTYCDEPDTTDVRSIPPNKPRPIEVTQTQHLFKERGFSD